MLSIPLFLFFFFIRSFDITELSHGALNGELEYFCLRFYRFIPGVWMTDFGRVTSNFSLNLLFGN